MTRVNRMYILLPVVQLLTVNSFAISLEMWQNECPFSNFCTIESLEKINETADPKSQPCCPSCSCDKDCFVFENCCPDVLTSTPVDLQKAKCTNLKINTNHTRNYFTDEYRVINFCPRDYDVIDRQLVDQCEERLVNDLTDVVAVSDIENRIYKNKYCALCQGVRDFVSWTLKLYACSESFDKTSLSASQSTKAILNQCALHSIPPDDGGQYDTMFCGHSLRSSCSSITTGSDSNVEDIRDKCLNGPYLPFTHVLLYNKNVLYKNVLYKNVFCYLCENGENDRHMCSKQDGPYGKGSGFRFIIILRLPLTTSHPPQVTPEIDPLQCAEFEIYDHVKGKCSRLFCPPYHVVFYGRCLELGEFINYGTQLRIIQSKPNDSIVFSSGSMIFETEASKAYARNILLEYGVGRCDIASVTMQAIVDKKADILVAMETRIPLVFDDKCDATSISHIVRKRLSKRHDTLVVINNKTVNLTGQITFYDQSLELSQNTDLFDRWTVLHLDGNANRRALMKNDFFLCPHFIVDIQQYNSITTDVFRDGNERNLTEISELTSLENGFYSLTNDSIAICIDTYFELYAKSGGLLKMVAWSLLYGIGLSLSTFLSCALVN